MQIKIKKIREDGVIPSYAHSTDIGLDLTATSINIENNKQYGYIEYGTSLAIAIPENHVGLIFPRSSISKTGMIMANSVGCIDPGYTGEIKIRFKYIPNSLRYEIGNKIAQLVIIPCPIIEFEEVNELSNTERNADAFGSSGN